MKYHNQSVLVCVCVRVYARMCVCACVCVRVCVHEHILYMTCVGWNMYIYLTCMKARKDCSITRPPSAVHTHAYCMYVHMLYMHRNGDHEVPCRDRPCCHTALGTCILHFQLSASDLPVRGSC